MVAILLAAAIVGGIAGAAIGVLLAGNENGDTNQVVSFPAQATSPASSGSDADPGAVYRSDAPGVVVITDTQTRVGPGDAVQPVGQEKVGALGSGFVLDANGDIVTNDHVVAGSTGIRVGFSGGATYPATIVGTDPSTRHRRPARQRARVGALHPLAFDDSAAIQVGDPVYAIGNPFGLERTMTAGIVSATGRDIQLAQRPHDPERDPDRRADQPRQLGRAAARPRRPRRRRQRADRGRHGRRQRRHRLRHRRARRRSPWREQLIATGHAQHPWLGVQIDDDRPDAWPSAVRGLPAHGVAVVRSSRAARPRRRG